MTHEAAGLTSSSVSVGSSSRDLYDSELSLCWETDSGRRGQVNPRPLLGVCSGTFIPKNVSQWLFGEEIVSYTEIMERDKHPKKSAV